MSCTVKKEKKTYRTSFSLILFSCIFSYIPEKKKKLRFNRPVNDHEIMVALDKFSDDNFAFPF